MLKRIWDSMTGDQRNKVISALILDGASSSAVYAWVRGERVPRKLYRDAFSRYINRYAGQTTTPEELWPESSEETKD